MPVHMRIYLWQILPGAQFILFSSSVRKIGGFVSHVWASEEGSFEHIQFVTERFGHG